jgi:hypothetical protein
MSYVDDLEGLSPWRNNTLDGANYMDARFGDARLVLRIVEVYQIWRCQTKGMEHPPTLKLWRTKRGKMS